MQPRVYSHLLPVIPGTDSGSTATLMRKTSLMKINKWMYENLEDVGDVSRRLMVKLWYPITVYLVSFNGIRTSPWRSPACTSFSLNKALIHRVHFYSQWFLKSQWQLVSPKEAAWREKFRKRRFRVILPLSHIFSFSVFWCVVIFRCELRRAPA